MSQDFRSRLLRFLTDCGAAIAPIYTVMMIPIFGATAAAVDYGMWLGTKTELQAIADAAVLAGAKKFADGSDSDAIAEAQNVLSAHGLGADVEKNVFVVEPGRTLSVRLATDGEPIMSGLISKDGARISASATATTQFHGPPCVLALNPHAEWGIQINGSAKLIAEGCTLWSNSDGDESFRSYPATYGRADRICAVGNIYARGDVLPNPESGCPPVGDPFAEWEPPSPEACMSASAAAGTMIDGVLHLQPGTYCGGISLENGQVVMEPGIYTIKDGPFALHGNVEVTGEGVGIYMTGYDSRLHFAGTGKLRIAAMKDGEMAGMAIARDPDAYSVEESKVGKKNTETTSTVIGNFTLGFEGTVYLPNHTFTFWGNSDSDSPPPLSMLVADRIEVGGSGILHLRANIEDSEVPTHMQPVEIVRLID